MSAADAADTMPKVTIDLGDLSAHLVLLGKYEAIIWEISRLIKNPDKNAAAANITAMVHQVLNRADW